MPSSAGPDLLSPIIRHHDLPFTDLERFPNALEDITDNRLDLLLIRGAFPRHATQTAGRSLREHKLDWLRLNDGKPAIDISLLGWPSFPTFKAPKGPSPEDHFAMSPGARAMIDGLFGDGFDPQRRFEEVLARLGGGRPVRLPPAPEGKQFLPYTVRYSPEGAGTLSHVDHHFHLPFFRDIAPELDNTTLLSMFVILQSSEAGGELVLYDLKRGQHEVPLGPNGFWDQQAIETRYGRTVLTPGEGDMIVFSAGRCFHKVEPAIGPSARISFGSLMALTRVRDSVWYWG